MLKQSIENPLVFRAKVKQQINKCATSLSDSEVDEIVDVVESHVSESTKRMARNFRKYIHETAHNPSSLGN